MRAPLRLLWALLLLLPVSAPVAAQVALEDSIAVYRAAMVQAQIEDDSARVADFAYALGLAHWQLDHYDSALVHLTHAREIRRAVGDSNGLGRVLNALGATHYQAGNYGPALESFLASLAIRRSSGDRRGIAVNLANIGKTYQDWRQYERAIGTLEEAVAEAERSGDNAVIGYTLHSLGSVKADVGASAEARDLFRRSLEAYGKLNTRRTPQDSLAGWSLNALALARLDTREGRPADALAVLAAVLDAAARQESTREQADALNATGAAYLRLGQPTNALASYERAYSLASQVSQRAIALEALDGMARTREALGDVRGALRDFRAHRALADSVFNRSTAQRIAAMEIEAEVQRTSAANALLRAEQREQAVALNRQRKISMLSFAVAALSAVLVSVLLWFGRLARRRADELAQTNEQLRSALSEVHTLSGFIPICANCKNIRDDDGYWKSIETYVSSRSGAQFSHAICNNCGPALYGADWEGNAPPEPRDEPAR